VHLPDPLAVSPRQIVVDGDDVDALAGEGVEVSGEHRDKGLPFARPHLCDLSVV
jgi:hypothetical protein